MSSSGERDIPERDVGRRTLLLAGAASLLAGCAVAGRAGSPAMARATGGVSRSSAPTASSSPSTPTRPEEALPAAPVWAPTGDEVEPAAKIAAARVVEALGSVPAGALRPDATTTRLAAVGAPVALAARAGALVPPGAPAVVEVVYPQYGGLTATAASLMTVVRQTWWTGDTVATRTVTADIRLARTGGTWAVAELLPVEPVDSSGTALPPPAAALVANSRVVLPDAAAADLATGTIDARVVEALSILSRRFVLAVSVFRSGHPEHVFGTDRTSNHTRGRAVDIWAIDGRPVATLGVGDPILLEVLEAADRTGAGEVGGPVDPDGPGGVHFTDQVHRDHVHLGFDG